MRVLVVSTCHPPASIYAYGANIVAALDGSATLINVVVDPAKWSLAHVGTDVRPPTRFAALNALASSSRLNRVVRELLRNDPSIAILHYIDQILRPAAPSGLQSVTTVHDDPEQVLTTDLYFEAGAWGRMKRRALRHRMRQFMGMESVIAVSDSVRDALGAWGFTGRIETVYPPVAPQFHPIAQPAGLRPALELPTDKRLILSISTTVPRKNLAVVRACAERLGDGYRLVRVGRPVGESITFPSPTDDELNMIFNACDVLLQPSLAEGCPATVLQAMATGLPVVGSDLPPFREVAGPAAVLVDPRSVAAACEGVEKAIDSREALRKKGFERSERFGFDRFRSRMNEVYDSIAG